MWVSSDAASAEENETTNEAALAADHEDGEVEPPALEAKYLIIGGGTAAFSAIKELKKMDPSAKVRSLR